MNEIKLNKNLVDYLNSKSIELIDLIEETKDKKDSPKLSGSIDHKNVIELTSSQIFDVKVGDEFGPYGIHENGKKIGFLSKGNRLELLKFILQIGKQKEINSQVSDKYLSEITCNWLINKYKGANEDYFYNFLIREIQNSLSTWKVLFPIKYLDIEIPFSIGDVLFTYFSEGDIDKLNTSLNVPKTQIEEYKKKYVGQVFASMTLQNMEKNRAIEVAKTVCSIGVNVLKIFSQTTFNPLNPTAFELEWKVNFNATSEVHTIEIDEIKQTIDWKVQTNNLAPNYNYLSKEYLHKIIDFGIKDVATFILNPPKTELEKQILFAINYMSESISLQDLQKRIVNFFTILESFVLKNEDASILESLKKYCPKIVYKELDQRKKFKSVINSLYQIRSALIHHGKSVEVDIDELKFFQISILKLIVKLIHLRANHDTKLSILDDIDKAIDEASL